MMRVTAPNGEEIVIDLDPSTTGMINVLGVPMPFSMSTASSRNSIATNEARRLRNFIRMNQTEESKALFEEGMRRAEKEGEILFQKEIDSAIAAINLENEDYQKKKDAFFDFQNTVSRLGAKFEGLDIRDLNRDPVLKAEYEDYKSKVSELEKQRREILAQENLLESKGSRLDALAGIYHDERKQGTFGGKLRNQVLGGLGDVFSELICSATIFLLKGLVFNLFLSERRIKNG